MRRKTAVIALILLQYSLSLVGQPVRMKVNTFNTPLFTLFSPMTLTRSAVTSITSVPTLTTSTGGNTLTLTNQNGCEAVAATFNNTFNPSKDWQLQFTYTLISPGGPGSNADGIAVSVHNDPRGTSAVGATGGALGCGGAGNNTCGDISSGTIPIRNSVDWEFEIYSGAGNYGATLQTINGSAVVYTVSAPASISPVIIAPNAPIAVTMRYTASTTTLTVNLNNGINTKTFTYTVNIASVVGSSGYLAFTGATGAVFSTQTITNVQLIGSRQ